MKPLLNFHDHNRSFNNFIYVYPVVSRRSGGVSLGINLNLNKACNWRCVYCQVDGLVRGKPEAINLEVLEQELDSMIAWIVNGDFLQENVPINLRRFNDIALSGNGEPTLSTEFLQVTNIIYNLRAKYNLSDVKTVLITNGSEIFREEVQAGIKIIARSNGEVWFKIDRATPKGIAKINQVNLNLDGVIDRLKTCSNICKTYIQTCLFKDNGQNPTCEEIDTYIELIKSIKNYIQGVFLYSTARNPALPEGLKISQVDEDFLQQLSNRLIENQISVKYTI